MYYVDPLKEELRDIRSTVRIRGKRATCTETGLKEGVVLSVEQ